MRDMQHQNSQKSDLSIHVLNLSEQKDFFLLLDDFGFSFDFSYYERCLERQKNEELFIVLAKLNEKYCGYTLFNLQPKYSYFKKCGLPEIQDLNVLRSYRRRGIGESLIKSCEEFALARGYDEMGIGVGLDSSFGAAQRLYARLGYIPDGAGVTYDRKQVAVGEFRPIDENLCLMMTKKLK